MAFTRKWLKALGIDDEKIDEIIDAHVESTDALKEYKAQYEDAEKKVKELTEKLDSVADDGYKAKYEKVNADLEKVRAEFDSFKTEQTEKDRINTVKTAYTKMLKDNGITNDRLIDTILKVTQFSGFNVLEDGTLEDAENITNGIKENWGAFIGTDTVKGADVTTPPDNNQGDVDLDKMTMREYAEYRKKKGN